MLFRVSEPERILFFDGDCGLCRRSVRFLMKQDRRRRMHFAPLQGETSKRLLEEPLRAQLDSVVYHPGDEPPLTRSGALIRFLTDCGGILSIPAQLLGLLPRRMLDGAYDCIARRRHRLAPASTCPTGASETDGRILP